MYMFYAKLWMCNWYRTIENRNYHIVDLFLLDAINFYTYGMFQPTSFW